MEDATQALTPSGDGQATRTLPSQSPQLPSAGPVQLDTLDDVFRLGEVLAQSGFFSDARQAGRAVTKVLAGAELGLSPIAAMTGIHVIKGKITMSANVVASQIKRSARYDFRVADLTDDRCTIHFFESGEKIGESEFTRQDAKRAGTQNMGSFPRNMLYARAMTNGAKWFCPDVFNGPVYTPEEMGAPVDGDTGEIEEAYWEDVGKPSRKPQRGSLPKKAASPKTEGQAPQQPQARSAKYEKGLRQLKDKMQGARDLRATIDLCFEHAEEEWGWGDDRWEGERMQGLIDAARDVQLAAGVAPAEVYIPGQGQADAFEQADAGAGGFQQDLEALGPALRRRWSTKRSRRAGRPRRAASRRCATGTPSHPKTSATRSWPSTSRSARSSRGRRSRPKPRSTTRSKTARRSRLRR